MMERNLHFGTGWNTQDIIFVDENSVEQFRIKNTDGIGTWKAIYSLSYAQFRMFKLTTAVCML